MVGVVWLLWGDGSEGYLGTGIKVRGKVLWGLRSVCHLVLAWHVARPSVMHLDRRSVTSRHLNMVTLPPLPNHERTNQIGMAVAEQHLATSESKEGEVK